MSDSYYPVSTQPNVTEPIAQKSRFNSLAVVSFALGLTSGLLALPAVIAGHFALANLKKGAERGKALAVIGLVLGYLQIATLILFTVLFWSAVAASFDEWQHNLDDLNKQLDMFKSLSGSLDS